MNDPIKLDSTPSDAVGDTSPIANENMANQSDRIRGYLRDPSKLSDDDKAEIAKGRAAIAAAHERAALAVANMKSKYGKPCQRCGKKTYKLIEAEIRVGVTRRSGTSFGYFGNTRRSNYSVGESNHYKIMLVCEDCAPKGCAMMVPLLVGAFISCGATVIALMIYSF